MGPARRGRPRKRRPQPGSPVVPGMSHRDIEATGLMSRHQIRQALAVAAIPREDFERMVESDVPTVTELARVGRALSCGASRQKRTSGMTPAKVRSKLVALAEAAAEDDAPEDVLSILNGAIADLEELVAEAEDDAAEDAEAE